MNQLGHAIPLETSTLAAALEQARGLIQAALQTSSSQLDALSQDPAQQNPSVRMLSTSPRALVVRKSGLSLSGWSPFAQDWSLQFEFVARLVREQHLSKVRSLLDGAVIEDREHGKVRLAPQVLHACKPLIGVIPLSS